MLTVAVTVYSNAQSAADKNNNSELAITEDGKRLEATIICLDAVEAPTKYNEFAKQFITLPSFPKKLNSSNEDLKKNIDNWFKNNPSMIDKVRTERKKAHDALYGPRPY